MAFACAEGISSPMTRTVSATDLSKGRVIVCSTQSMTLCEEIWPRFCLAAAARALASSVRQSPSAPGIGISLRRADRCLTVDGALREGDRLAQQIAFGHGVEDAELARPWCRAPGRRRPSSSAPARAR